MLGFLFSFALSASPPEPANLSKKEKYMIEKISNCDAVLAETLLTNSEIEKVRWCNSMVFINCNREIKIVASSKTTCFERPSWCRNSEKSLRFKTYKPANLYTAMHRTQSK